MSSEKFEGNKNSLSNLSSREKELSKLDRRDKKNTIKALGRKALPYLAFLGAALATPQFASAGNTNSSEKNQSKNQAVEQTVENKKTSDSERTVYVRTLDEKDLTPEQRALFRKAEEEKKIDFYAFVMKGKLSPKFKTIKEAKDYAKKVNYWVDDHEIFKGRADPSDVVNGLEKTDSNVKTLGSDALAQK